jgi:hypothetical protein
MYVDCTVNYKGRDIKIKFSTEDGFFENNFESVFSDLNEFEYDQAYDEFLDDLPLFDLKTEGFENA